MRTYINIFLFICCALIARNLHADFIDVNRLTLVSFPALNVSGLEKYKGHNLTIYYAIGSRATIRLQKSQIFVKNVRTKISFPIEGDTVKIPAASVPRLGVFVPNIMILVVHSPGVFIWKNADQSLPAGEEEAHSQREIPILQAVDALTSLELTAMAEEQSGAPELQYRLVP